MTVVMGTMSFRFGQLNLRFGPQATQATRSIFCRR
jgi:hypothetical protein